MTSFSGWKLGNANISDSGLINDGIIDNFGNPYVGFSPNLTLADDFDPSKHWNSGLKLLSIDFSAHKT